MKLIFSEINLVFSIICSIFVEDKNNWTMINFSKFNSLYSVATYFNTENKCRDAIVQSRWGDDVVCPYCGQHHCNQRKDGRFCCSKCNCNFSEKVVALKCDKTDGATLLPIIDQFVAEGSNIYTDELTSYNGLDATKYTHKVVNHGRSEYVKGADFTNTIEGFWGTLKRMIEGIYHSISSKYLQRYVDEAVYRWNTRRMSGCDSFRYMFKASIGVVDYEMVKQVA